MGAGLSANGPNHPVAATDAWPCSGGANEEERRSMSVTMYDTIEEMADAAAAAEELSRCIAEKGRATFMAATDTSQLNGNEQEP